MTDYTNELDRLQTYARQNGDAAALHLAADDLIKLRAALAALAALHPNPDAYPGALAELQQLKQRAAELDERLGIVSDNATEDEMNLAKCRLELTEAQATVAKLREALERIVSGTVDSTPPFRVAPASELIHYARLVLAATPERQPKPALAELQQLKQRAAELERTANHLSSVSFKLAEDERAAQAQVAQLREALTSARDAVFNMIPGEDMQDSEEEHYEHLTESALPLLCDKLNAALSASPPDQPPEADDWLDKNLPGIMNCWCDGAGCHWCHRNTQDPIAGHDGLCPIPALFTLVEAAKKGDER